jgi:hypothetical protein
MLTRSCGNVPFLIALSESFEHSRRLADDDGYDNLLWDTLKRGLIGLAPEFNQIFLVVNGVDEALCDQQTLLMKLVSILSEVPNMKLITLGMHKPMAADGQSFMELTAERIWEDISTIISASFEDKQTWLELSEVDQEVIVEQLTDASKGSFLWAKLASGLVCAQESLDQLREAVDSLITTKPSVTGLVLLTLNQENVSIEAKHMLLLLAIAQRPLRPAELSILASILIDEQIVPVGDMEFKASIYQSLSSLSDLVSFSGNLISLRHGMIKDSVLEVLSHSKLDSDEDPDTDFLTRLFVYLNCSVENDSNPAFNPLDQHTAATLQNENPLLQYAVRYWPVHFQNLPVSQQNSTIGRLEKITNCLPMSTTFIRLLSTVWDGLPKPQCLSYHEITTDLYRKSVGDDNVVTLQCVILLASQYRQVGSVEKAITLYYEAAMYSRKAFTERLHLTSQLVNAFLELTTDQITSSLTEIMRQRHEVLLLLVECHKLQYGDTSEELIATMRLLAEHHQTVGEKQEAQEVLASIKHSC